MQNTDLNRSLAFNPFDKFENFPFFDPLVIDSEPFLHQRVSPILKDTRRSTPVSNVATQSDAFQQPCSEKAKCVLAHPLISWLLKDRKA